MIQKLKIVIATEKDAPLILDFIKELAEYEKRLNEVVATEEVLLKSLFGDRHIAEVIIGYLNETPVGFALYFHNFSTFLGKPGIYLEDLYVRPEYRSKGIGKEMLKYLARLTIERDCGRLEWSVLNWNQPAIDFYKKLGAKPKDEWTMYQITAEALKLLSQ